MCGKRPGLNIPTVMDTARTLSSIGAGYTALEARSDAGRYKPMRGTDDGEAETRRQVPACNSPVSRQYGPRGGLTTAGHETVNNLPLNTSPAHIEVTQYA